ncbi:uncharacterized protein LOC141914930 [Tubulanus polymorphus]|uniref:uncharacterized protein LOC141914930 n=1 Tax=Tubulanus polymorphus TaxID=672921 RepID=UPI003DA3E5F3
MFITVNYGDNEFEIFNPNCKNHLLLENIRKRCNCQIHDIVELCDDKGVIKHLRSNPFDYGTNYVTSRENLVLVKVDTEDNENNRTTYISLLAGKETDTQFMSNLNPKMMSLSSLRKNSRGIRSLTPERPAAAAAAARSVERKLSTSSRYDGRRISSDRSAGRESVTSSNRRLSQRKRSVTSPRRRSTSHNPS